MDTSEVYADRPEDFPGQDAWKLASDRYTEDLTEEEKHLFYKCSPESLLSDANALVKNHSKHSKSCEVAVKLQPLIDAIGQYGKALDVYSNSYPLVLCPLWGSIRVVLHIASEFGKYFEKLVDMFDRIGDVLPRFRVYERLFASHTRLIQAISQAYLDIVAFCSRCKAAFRKGQRFICMTGFQPKRKYIRRTTENDLVTSSGIAFKLIWKPFKKQFGQQIISFREHRKSVEKEAGLSHMIEAAGGRAIVLANQQGLERQREEDLHRRIFAMIPSIDHRISHEKLQRLRYQGTGEWFLHNQVFLDWRSKPSATFLCCLGIPGSGKSVLMSIAIDHIINHTRASDMRVIYYYCDYADQRTLQIDCILGTILKQLFKAERIPKPLESHVTSAFENGSRVPAASVLLNLVHSAINLDSEIYLIFDGLDECVKEVQQEILALIERLALSARSTIKVLMSCREEDPIVKRLQTFQKIYVTPSCLEDDIEFFVVGSVQSRMEARDLRIHSLELKNTVIAELTQKANGLFLWVVFQLEDLCDAMSDSQIRRTLRNLPNGLIETYDRILIKIRKNTTKASIALKLFQWIACARRPLHVDELSEAVAFDLSDKSWDAEKIPDENLMIEACRGLVVRDRVDKTVSFAHQTVQQYVLSQRGLGEDIPLSFRLEHARAFVGQMCVTYLSFSDFETQITPWKPAKTSSVGGPFYSDSVAFVPNIMGVGKYVYRMVYRLLGGDPTVASVDIDMNRYRQFNFKSMNRIPPVYSQKYRLLQYIVDYWVIFTTAYDSRVIEPKLLELVQEKILPFEFRPWGPNQHFGSWGCIACPDRTQSLLPSFQYMSLFHYCAAFGHWALMQPFVQLYCSHEKYTDETLMIACRHGRSLIVKNLLQAYKFDLHNCRAFRIATISGYTSILKLLLESHSPMKPPGVLSIPVTYGPELLILAAENGQEGVIDVLIREGYASLEPTKNDSCREVLSMAVKHGHDHVVRYLLKTGTKSVDATFIKDIEKSVDGLAADLELHLAAENGHDDVYMTLLQHAREHGDYDPRWVKKVVNVAGSNGETALHRAAKNGHSRMVEVLIECGASSMGSSISGSYPIHFAAFNGHVGVLEVLVRKGVGVNVETAEKHTSLEIAAENGHTAAVRCLAQAGGDLDKKSKGYLTPIEAAVVRGDADMVRVLVELGAFRGIAIHSAAKNCDLEIIRILLKDIDNTYASTVRDAQRLCFFALQRSERHDSPEARAIMKKFASTLTQVDSSGEWVESPSSFIT